MGKILLIFCLNIIPSFMKPIKIEATKYSLEMLIIKNQMFLLYSVKQDFSNLMAVIMISEYLWVDH